uniref:Uncharacterized protein n=1 Tax=Glossina palpalis gambiensis TaxID=67801 RepID=A0A1B0C679_9MUSC
MPEVEVKYGGRSAILALIRVKYWIVQERQLIKGNFKRFVACLCFHGKCAKEPWTVLPIARLAAINRLFKTTGVDFVGPRYIGTEANSEQKVCTLLFACTPLRAIHLKLVGDMSTKSCINALRKYICVSISDNAKPFKRVDLQLRKLELLVKCRDAQNMAAY